MTVAAVSFCRISDPGYATRYVIRTIFLSAYNFTVTISRLPETVLTLYAELLDQLRTAELQAGGSFVSKQIRGATYWYFQTVEGGRKRQRYVGRESPEVLEKIQRASESRQAASADELRRRELVAMLAAGGMHRESAAISAVLKMLDNAGVFRSGGVLVGTQAFSCYANMLGVRFEAQSVRTADIDVGHDPAVLLAWSGDTTSNVLDELRRVEPFFAVPGFDSREPSTSFKVRGRDLRVDFLAPASRSQTRPVLLPQLNIAAQPLAGLDYLLDDPIAAAVVGGNGILVNVPQPARFALHKLWVSRQRPASEQAKARKDLRQAEQLIEVLKDDRPHDLRVAIAALKHRPSMLRAIRPAARKLELLDV